MATRRPKTVLCPIDFSEHSDQALARACEVAELSGAKLYIVHVDVSHARSLPGASDYVPELDVHRRLLEEATPESKKLRYEHHCLRGDVETEILRFSMLREVDRIIMGTHGRTGLIAKLMGSIATSICRKAVCDVETVSAGKKAGRWQRAVAGV